MNLILIRRHETEKVSHPDVRSNSGTACRYPSLLDFCGGQGWPQQIHVQVIHRAKTSILIYLLFMATIAVSAQHSTRTLKVAIDQTGQDQLRLSKAGAGNVNASCVTVKTGRLWSF